MSDNDDIRETCNQFDRCICDDDSDGPCSGDASPSVPAPQGAIRRTGPSLHVPCLGDAMTEAWLPLDISTEHIHLWRRILPSGLAPSWCDVAFADPRRPEYFMYSPREAWIINRDCCSQVTMVGGELAVRCQLYREDGVGHGTYGVIMWEQFRYLWRAGLLVRIRADPEVLPLLRAATRSGDAVAFELLATLRP